MQTPGVPITSDEVLSFFGEVILWLDASRRISHISGATDAVLGLSADELDGLTWIDFLEQHANAEARGGLYWAVEAAFNEYVPRRFLPSEMAFRAGWTAGMAIPDTDQVIIRLQPTSVDKLDVLVSKDLRLALSSAVGFTDVILKGIDGPLTDIQVEDLNVVANDSQFAQRLVEDLRAQILVPHLLALVPVSVRRLLQLDADDLPQRRLNSQQLTLAYDLPGKVAAYSNGAIRAALIDLIKALTQSVVKQSQITIQARVSGEFVNVYVTYLPLENSMRANRPMEPVELLYRRAVKRHERLLSTVSSLHSRLCAYGCTAQAFPADDPQFTTIMMNVPVWHGPLD